MLLDMGVISEEAALKRILSRLDSDKERELAALCFEQWHLYNMHPKAGMDKVVRELKERGFGLYVCSNASLRLPACSGRVIPEAQLFDGMLFSAQVKCMKPQKEMYGHLFSMFHLKPEECFFVDDWDLNIEGAAACGMRGYCFEDGMWRSCARFWRNCNKKHTRGASRNTCPCGAGALRVKRYKKA